METLEKDLRITETVKQTKLQHIAIIMDGNRRWARERNLPSAVGHKKGVDALKTTLRACKDFGIKYLTVYAFSTENWNRKKEEVEFLMELLALTIQNELQEMHSEGVVIKFIGDLTRLNQKLQKILNNAMEVTKNNTGVNFQIAFNYGARDEIVNAVKSIATEGIKPDDITEEVIARQIKLDLFNVTEEELKNVVIAYEPVWAIGTGKTATADQSEEVCAFIRATIAKLYNQAAADAVTIQYGGSMNDGNADELLSKTNVDGGLIGGASLVAEKFAAIVKAASK